MTDLTKPAGPGMPATLEDAHIKILAELLVLRMANPFHFADMNDDSICWQDVYDEMRRAYDDECGNMFDVLSVGLIAISGHDPWDVESLYSGSNDDTKGTD